MPYVQVHDDFFILQAPAYCSPQCQALEWAASHKVACKEMRDLQARAVSKPLAGGGGKKVHDAINTFFASDKGKIYFCSTASAAAAAACINIAMYPHNTAHTRSKVFSLKFCVPIFRALMQRYVYRVEVPTREPLGYGLDRRRRWRHNPAGAADYGGSSKCVGRCATGTRRHARVAAPDLR
jgi:hypothetical protein